MGTNRDAQQLRDFKESLFSKVRIEARPDEFVPYVPHTGQEPIHFDLEARYWVVSAGQRSGKTLSVALEVVCELAQRGTRTWIVAPNYDLTQRCFEMVYDFVVRQQVLGPDAVVKASNTKDMRRIETKWNSWVQGKTAENPNSLVGEQLDLIVFDEAAQCSEAIFLQYLQPRLVNRDGRALMISSPRGYNWFRDVWMYGLDPEMRDKGWRCGQFRTADNPYVSEDLLDSMRAAVPDHIWSQEYEGNFEQFSGQIWPDFKARMFDPNNLPSSGHLFNPRQHPVHPQWTHYRAIDVGYRHPTVCLWAAVDGESNVWVYKEYSDQNIVAEDHAQNISSLTEHPIQTTWISADAKRKNPLLATREERLSAWEVYRKNGILTRPVSAGPDSVNAGNAIVARYLRATLEDRPEHPRLLISTECPQLQKGILEYVFAETHTHHHIDAPDKPRKYQDDFADALRYLLHTHPRHVPYWQTEQARYEQPKLSRRPRQRLPGLAYTAR